MIDAPTRGVVLTASVVIVAVAGTVLAVGAVAASANATDGGHHARPSGVGAVADLSSGQETVSSRQARLRQVPEVATTIEAEASAESAAFDRPAEISGRIRTARGEPLADKQVTLDVGERTYEPETDAEGRFAVTYRPVGVAVDATAVNVTYRPGESTPYLAASTSVPLSIDRVEANVTVTVDPTTTRLGTDIQIAASAGAGDRVVPSLPIQFSVADRDVGADLTGAGGVAGTNWSVPADVPPGEYTVRATVGQRDGAVRAPVTTRAVAVEQTPTALSVDATATGDAVTVDGRLTLADSAPGARLPADLPIRVSVGDHTETVRAGPEGGFDLSVPLAEADTDRETATVRARFDGTDTNLGAAMFERTVPVASDAGLVASLDDETLAVVGGAAVVGLLVLALLVRRWLRGRRVGEREAAVGDHPGEAPLGEGGVVGPGDGPTPGVAVGGDEEWLAGAREAIAEGSVERGVASAYAAAHGHVTERLALDGVLTPRELLAAADGRLDPEALEALERLTEIYERVVFASEATEDLGELAIDAAATVVGVEQDEPTATEADDD